jgi:hypothetical protein
MVVACSTFRTEHETGAARRAPAATSFATPWPAPQTRPRADDFAQLVSAELAGCDLAVDAASVYFVTAASGHAGGTLARVPKVGGPVEILTPKLSFVDDFALLGDTVFFAERLTAPYRACRSATRSRSCWSTSPPGSHPFQDS